MKKMVDKIIDAGRPAALAAGAGYGLSKVMNSVGKLSQKDKKTLTKFGFVFTGIAAVIASAIGLNIWSKKRTEAKGKVEELDAEASRYERERRADADLYTLQRMADGDLIKTKAQTGVYRQRKYNGEDSDDDDDYTLDNGNTNESKITWLEKFKSNFELPTLPPFLEKIMHIVPDGYEQAMLLHLLSMLGALCFSKIRAKYLDNDIHAPNIQVIVEGAWGSGKAKFEKLYKLLFDSVIFNDIKKINSLDDGAIEEGTIIQTCGLGTSMSRFTDILAVNQGVHAYFFNSEVRALFYDMKKSNGINFDFIRKAFENGWICRNNRARDSKNGIFPIFLNYTITGTPKDISTTFKKELEGGTLSRICWTTIPEQGREGAKLGEFKTAELSSIREQISTWQKRYCYREEGGHDVAASEFHLNLDYICEALDGWNKEQYDLAEDECNHARKDVRMRMATIAFHCGMVIHMLYGNKDDKTTRQKVINLVIYIANYCTERFLWKYGDEQNELHSDDEKSGKVRTEKMQPQSTSDKITDIAELYRLHQIKDEKGNNMYGWDTLTQLSGMSRSTLIRKVTQYGKSQQS